MTGRFARIPEAALGRGLEKNDWSVLAVICLHADRDGRAFPSMSTIATESHIDRPNVPRSLAKLEALDLIRRKRVPRRGGGWQNNIYQVVFDSSDASTGMSAETDDRCRVVSGEDTSRHVVVVDSTETKDVIRGENTMASAVKTDVIGGDALTDHSTDPYQEEGVTGVSDRTHAHERAGTLPCGFYVVGEHGYRLCGKPCLEGHATCAEHTPATLTARNISARVIH